MYYLYKTKRHIITVDTEVLPELFCDACQKVWWDRDFFTCFSDCPQCSGPTREPIVGADYALLLTTPTNPFAV